LKASSPSCALGSALKALRINSLQEKKRANKKPGTKGQERKPRNKRREKRQEGKRGATGVKHTVPSDTLAGCSLGHIPTQHPPS
jgi:hypothetical protein